MIGFNHLGKLGRLANQMFQYASLIGIADKLGVDYTIPKHNEKHFDGINNLRIELFDCFDIKPSNVGELKTGRYIREDGFHFNKFLFNMNKEPSMSLYGFFQSEKYFKHVEDEIRKQFVFKRENIESCERVFEDNFENPISLHIRRGDYIKLSDNHNVLNLDYYEESLSRFSKDREVIIFSDDTNWCKQQKIFDGSRFFISECKDPYIDLCLMSMCSDFIIANSSYSWWGAWLANRGKVIAPSKWFGPANAHLNTKDLYLDSWEVI